MRFSKRLLVLGCLFIGLSPFACKSISNRGGDLSEVKAAAVSNKLSSTNLKSEAEYLQFAKPSDGLLPGAASMKFLARLPESTLPWNSKKPEEVDIANKVAVEKNYDVDFMNGNFTGSCAARECNKYHVLFAIHQGYVDSDTWFNDNTYFVHQKKFFAGTLNRYVLEGKGTIYGIQLFPQDVANEKNIVNVVNAIKRSFTIPDAKLYFIQTGNQQFIKEKANLDALAKAGVGLMTMDDILGSTNFFPMNDGTAYGYLRMFPKDQENIVATDIVVFDELPLDLSVVSGVITKAYQDTNSHINLKSKERKTPNMVLRDAGPNHPQLSQLIDKPVKLFVGRAGYEISLSTDAAVKKAFQENLAKKKAEKDKKRPEKKWSSSRTIEVYSGMCPSSPKDCLARKDFVGSKSANLGFLQSVFQNQNVPTTRRNEKGELQNYDVNDIGYDAVPDGFGIPIQFYEDLVKANPTLESKLAAFIKAENNGELSNAQKSADAAAIRDLFLNATLPKENVEAVIAKMRVVNSKINEWKIRSSASSEDVEGFDGAGLHDSYAGKIDKEVADSKCKLVENPGDEPGELSKLKVKPKSISCAMKGVYASLWNKRAIDERSFALMDHTMVGMGLAVVPTYDNEGFVAANSVVVTRIINSPDIMGISISIQDKNNTVTNPTPGTASEITVAISAGVKEIPSLSTLRFAKPLADKPAFTRTVLDEENTFLMAALSRKVEEAYCQANLDYYAKKVLGTENPRPRDVIKACSEVSFDPYKPKALDFEMKVICLGKKEPKSDDFDLNFKDCSEASGFDSSAYRYEFVVKQVREFAGK